MALKKGKGITKETYDGHWETQIITRDYSIRNPVSRMSQDWENEELMV